MKQMLLERDRQDTILYQVDSEKEKEKNEDKRQNTIVKVANMEMSETDLAFLKIDGYSLSKKQLIAPERELCVRFLEDGTPDWDNLRRVADCILFELDVDDFTPLEKKENGKYWVPYKFRLSAYGDCIVRVWPSQS